MCFTVCIALQTSKRLIERVSTLVNSWNCLNISKKCKWWNASTHWGHTVFVDKHSPLATHCPAPPEDTLPSTAMSCVTALQIYWMRYAVMSLWNYLCTFSQEKLVLAMRTSIQREEARLDISARARFLGEASLNRRFDYWAFTGLFCMVSLQFSSSCTYMYKCTVSYATYANCVLHAPELSVHWSQAVRCT